MDILQDYYGMGEDTKILSKNGYDDDPVQEEVCEGELSQDECRAFRGLAARLNYMASDNMYVQFPAKEICRNMSNPGVRDFMKIKRVVRFLKGVGRVKLL